VSKRKPRPSEKISPGSIGKPSNKISDKELITFLRTKFFGPLKRHLKYYLPYLKLAHRRFAQPGRRIPIPGRPLWSEFCRKELGVHVRTVQLWLAGDRPASKKALAGKIGRYYWKNYDAEDIAHLEEVVRTAEELADGDPDNAEYNPIRKAIAKKPTVGNRKHFLLTPPPLMKQIEAEFGQNIFDPCPHPRPKGFDGLKVEWGDVNYVNPPIRKTDGEGISDWIRKMIVEQGKGRTSVLVYPCYSWFHMLLKAGAEMRSLGQVHWLATEDGTPQKASLPIVMFILRGHKKKTVQQRKAA
jgi:hypothetical protein